MSGDGKVLVAYLHSTKQVEHSFHQSLLGLANYDAAHNQRLFASSGPLMMRCGTGGLVEARNKVMQYWLDETGEEWLFSVDTDMGFAADTVDRLVDAADPIERPVMGGLCFGLRLGDPDGFGGFLTRPFPTIYIWDQDDQGRPGFRAVADYPPDQVTGCAGTGAACLLVHRSAAEKVRAEAGDEWFTPVRYQDGRMVSEDLSFCYRLGTLGIPVHVDTRVKTTHAKQVWLGEQDFQAHRVLTQAAAAVVQQAQASPALIPLSVRPAAQRRPGVISVPLPSRGRPEMLSKSIASLREHASRPDLLEILVAHDPDDPQTAETARELGADVVWQAPQRYGYAGSAHYYAALLEQATGEWCLPSWGDDGMMLTQGWDDIVRAQPAPSVLFTRGGDKWGNNCFPIVHMDVFTAVGRFTDLPAVDTWYDDLGKLAGVWRDPGIVLMQDRFDLTGNNNDQTYAEGRAGDKYRAGDYYSPQRTKLRYEDAAAVAAWVAEHGITGSDPQTLPVRIDTVRTLEEFGFVQGMGDMLKHPDDLDRYSRIIDATQPEVIVETGTRTGVSAMWFAGQPGAATVITVDVDNENKAIVLGGKGMVRCLRGDSADPLTVESVKTLVAGRRCMVVLDSCHTATHVTKEIELYGPLVTPGCYLVVEDGIFRYAPRDKWMRHNFGDPEQGNPLDAIEATLAQDPGWCRDVDIEQLHPISHHPGGFWLKVE